MASRLFSLDSGFLHVVGNLFSPETAVTGIMIPSSQDHVMNAWYEDSTDGAEAVWGTTSAAAATSASVYANYVPYMAVSAAGAAMRTARMAPVTAGVSYLAIIMTHNDTSSSTLNSTRGKIWWYDADEVLLSSERFGLAQNVAGVADAGWNEVVTAPASAAFCRIGISAENAPTNSPRLYLMHPIMIPVTVDGYGAGGSTTYPRLSVAEDYCDVSRAYVTRLVNSHASAGGILQLMDPNTFLTIMGYNSITGTSRQIEAYAYAGSQQDTPASSVVTAPQLVLPPGSFIATQSTTALAAAITEELAA